MKRTTTYTYPPTPATLALRRTTRHARAICERLRVLAEARHEVCVSSKEEFERMLKATREEAA